MPVQTQVQMRRDTAANWTSTNPTLASGEWGLETDTRLMKIGDGTTAWNSLSYQLGPLLDEVIPTDPTGMYFTGSGLKCYGVGSNFVSAPDAAALDITGDIDLRAKVALDDWTPSAINFIIGKGSGISAQTSYHLVINTDGTIGFRWSADGSNTNDVSSTVATGLTDGSTKWIRATFDVNNGASGRDIAFYLSDDGSTWTQLGTTVTQAGTTSIFNSTSTLQIAGRATTALSFFPASGTIYRAQILNGIAGTTVFDANFENVAADSFAFSESSANAATVTLTTTRYSFGVPGLISLAQQSVNLGLTNTDIYHPFQVRGKAITLKHLAYEETATRTPTVYMAIYAADSQMQPTGSPLWTYTATMPGALPGIFRIRLTPFVLNPGNYVFAYNCGSTSWDSRGPQIFGFVPNTLGASQIRAYTVTRTAATFTSSPTKWNTRNTGTPFFPVLFGWS